MSDLAWYHPQDSRPRLDVTTGRVLGTDRTLSSETMCRMWRIWHGPPRRRGWMEEKSNG